MNDDQNARTIHCGNLNADKITEELLYELFLQAGPLERVSIPKDNGKNRQYGFVTYKYQCSVPYAMNVFSGTKLFNRELRLNNRSANRNSNNNENNQSHSNQMQTVPPSLLPNMPTTHQFQMQNPFGNDALRGGGYSNRGSSMNQMNNMMPSAFNPNLPLQFPQNTQIDFQTLLAQSAQMLSMANGLAPIGNESHKHQSKMMHRHDSRPHNQNNNYNRDKDRRNDRNDRRQDQGRDRSRERSRSLERERKDWIRNKGKGSNRSDRRDRNHTSRGNNDRRR